MILKTVTEQCQTPGYVGLTLAIGVQHVWYQPYVLHNTQGGVSGDLFDKWDL